MAKKKVTQPETKKNLIRFFVIDSHIKLNLGRKTYGYAGKDEARIHTFMGWKNISITEGIQVIPYVEELDIFVGKGISILEDLGDHDPENPPVLPDKWKPKDMTMDTEYVLDTPPAPINKEELKDAKEDLPETFTVAEGQDFEGPPPAKVDEPKKNKNMEG